MENVPTLGQPIPTAVLTPTEIIAPAKIEAETVQREADAAIDNTERALPSMSLAVDMMFAPISFWASVTTAYLHLFDVTRDEALALRRH